MVHRGIATLALALMLCFLLLSHFDPQFFLLHFYESLIYLAITLMLFYFEDRWAYMLGIVAPTGWLLLTIASGGFGEFIRQANELAHIKVPEYPPAFIGGVITNLSVALIAICVRRWRREFKGVGKGLTTFLVSTGIVAVYYGLLVLWFWHSAAAPSHI